MTRGEEMRANAQFAALIAGVLIGVAAVVLTCVHFFGPKTHDTTGTVSHSGPYGVNGSTYFTLADTGENYYCFRNNAAECVMVKDGAKVAITYRTNWSGGHSVEDLRFIDTQPAPAS